MFPIIVSLFRFLSVFDNEKSAGLNCLAYPVYLGLRIAHHPRISNVEAHAVMKYDRNYESTMYIIPMDAGHRVIMRMMYLNLRSSVHRRLTFNSTSFQYVCRPPSPISDSDV